MHLIICTGDSCKSKLVFKVGSHGGDFGLGISLIVVGSVCEGHIQHSMTSLIEVRFSESTWIRLCGVNFQCSYLLVPCLCS